ncbi:MAG TPA: hypothetical protein ENI52_03770 [Thermoplasmata archaeon]|nr:hypothetical protein [Thermoplasmata archaeon]
MDMQFKVQYVDEHTSARKGTLKISHRTIDTPILWIGHQIGGIPKPWESFPLKTLIMNACDIIDHPKAYRSISRKGIHKFLNFDGMVMIDSGGFLFQKKNRLDVAPSDILDLYHMAKPELCVVLDHPLDPFQSQHKNYYRWKKTIENTIYMYNNNGNSVLLPVLHGYTLRKLRNACKKIKEIDEPGLIGLGSLVPLVFRRERTYNFNNSLHFIVDAIKLVRNEFPNAFLHVFGIGSTSSMHLMYSLGVDSLDSIGWRLKAAYGTIQLPGIGDRYLKKHPNRRRVINRKEMEILSKCECPACKNKSIKEQIEILDNSFRARALHNSWVFMKEQETFKQLLVEGKIRLFVENRLKNSPFLKAFHYFTNKRGDTN